MLTVVPDPERVLDEIARVVRPGGEIVLVNHIGAERGFRARIEAWLAGVAQNSDGARSFLGRSSRLGSLAVGMSSSSSDVIFRLSACSRLFGCAANPMSGAKGEDNDKSQSGRCPIFGHVFLATAPIRVIDLTRMALGAASDLG